MDKDYDYASILLNITDVDLTEEINIFSFDSIDDSVLDEEAGGREYEK